MPCHQPGAGLALRGAGVGRGRQAGEQQHGIVSLAVFSCPQDS